MGIITQSGRYTVFVVVDDQDQVLDGRKSITPLNFTSELAHARIFERLADAASAARALLADDWVSPAEGARAAPMEIDQTWRINGKESQETSGIC